MNHVAQSYKHNSTNSRDFMKCLQPQLEGGEDSKVGGCGGWEGDLSQKVVYTCFTWEDTLQN